MVRCGIHPASVPRFEPHGRDFAVRRNRWAVRRESAGQGNHPSALGDRVGSTEPGPRPGSSCGRPGPERGLRFRHGVHASGRRPPGAVVFPARRAQAGVPLAAIRSPKTGAARCPDELRRAEVVRGRAACSRHRDIHAVVARIVRDGHRRRASG